VRVGWSGGRGGRCAGGYEGLEIAQTERDRMANSVDHFEMRRLEDLSNTIFGVAMTLLASHFPRGPFQNDAPVWSTIWSTYQSSIVALLLSFVVAGMFWISHQRRLVYEPLATRSVLYLNLLFLLSVIALPITTGLYGTYGNARDIVVLYSCHLAVMSGLNAILWLLAALPRVQPDRVVAPISRPPPFLRRPSSHWSPRKRTSRHLCGAAPSRRRSSKQSWQGVDEIRP
jgi:uncharacterized membrane protein